MPRKPRTAFLLKTQWLHSCTCGHLGRWHRGRCRILNCLCEEFVLEPPVRYTNQGGAWMARGKKNGSTLKHGRATR